MEKITFVIPSRNNLRYLKWCLASIRQHASRKDHDIFVFNDQSDDGTAEWCASYAKTDPNFTWYDNTGESIGIGQGYNFGAKQAKTELIMFWHADMFMSKDSDKYLYDLIGPGIVACMTRIEPPLHPSGPEKVTKDLGQWPEPIGLTKDGFDDVAFQLYVAFARTSLRPDQKTTKGIFAPWMIYKDDFLRLGGHDAKFKFYYEDSDIFNRMVMADMKLIQSWDAYCYHLTCRAGKFQFGNLSPESTITPEQTEYMNEWQRNADGMRLDFIRKWGSYPLHDATMYPTINPIYNVVYDVSGVLTLQHLQLLEPFCKYIIINAPELKHEYIARFQPYSKFDLNNRIRITDEFETPQCDVIIKFNINQLTAAGVKFLLTIAQIVESTNSIGSFEYDIFQVEIFDITQKQHNLIYI